MIRMNVIASTIALAAMLTHATLVAQEPPAAANQPTATTLQPSPPPSPPAPAAAPSPLATPGDAELTPYEAREIAREAFVYGFPIVESYKTMYAQAIDRTDPGFK